MSDIVAIPGALSREHWVKIPTVAPYTWEAHRSGVIIAKEVNLESDEDTPLAAIGNPPFTLVAVPHRQGLPKLEVEIPMGSELIWCHPVKLAFEMNQGGKKMNGPTRFEYVCIGRRFYDGREEVWTVYPDGQVKLFSSLQEAVS